MLPIVGDVALSADLDRIAGLAAAHAGDGDAVSGVLASEPAPGERVYLCSFDGADGYRSWLAVRDDGSALETRAAVREAVSITALCEVAAESAAGGDLDALVARLEELREREAPEGIDGAIAAAHALRQVIGDPPQLATPARLDAIGGATRALERELDPVAPSPFSAAVKSAQGAVAELQREVEAGYRIALV
jgi:hypothetical protein